MEIGTNKAVSVNGVEFEYPILEITNEEVSNLLLTDKDGNFYQKNDLMASDIINGKYEGGFKVWEGAINLLRYLVD